MREIIVICDKIRSAYNVGSIFRTADALAVSKLYLISYTPTPKNQPKVAKTSLGAENSVQWEHVSQLKRLVDKLKADGFEIAALELNRRRSVDFREWKPSDKVALILGNEKTGVSPKIQALCDKVVQLPMMGKKNSLNVGVSFGAIGYYLRSDER
jgi:23S rRNA (guanosine2251-2'-O)-methyltransferase